MKRRTLPLPNFVGFRKREDRAEGRFNQAVLRLGRYEDVAWECEHHHAMRIGAITCALQARGQAIAGGLLPEPERRKWTD